MCLNDNEKINMPGKEGFYGVEINLARLIVKTIAFWVRFCED